ncbi:uncharacterized protein LOC108629974 isoform X2 [Ceratina calcarata]|uniref:Uncharacterized protein LOC108629974 isoform X2 n=1 Tax=Ceratina calcarata TaxID=156304 RepID=A0AAJ7JBB2_9HYME|nr:uncharacterized protein LOC108629974 isoform X2 [Ceratina calcarata]
MVEKTESKGSYALEDVEEGHEEVIDEDKVLIEEKPRVDVEVLDADLKPADVYQIRPQLYDKFKPLSAKEVIHNVLFDQLSAKTYNAEEAIQWTNNIADTIREKVKGEVSISRTDQVIHDRSTSYRIENNLRYNFRVKVQSLQIYRKCRFGSAARCWCKNGHKVHMGCRGRYICL